MAPVRNVGTGTQEWIDICLGVKISGNRWLNEESIEGVGSVLLRGGIVELHNGVWRTEAEIQAWRKKDDFNLDMMGYKCVL